MPFAVEISGLFGVLLVLVGSWAFLAPLHLIDVALRFATKGGLLAAAAIRLAMGLSLWFSAPHSRAPWLLQVLSVLVVLAALMLPFVGVERYRGLMDWWAGLGATPQRAWSLLAVAVGAAILWALLPTAT